MSPALKLVKKAFKPLKVAERLILSVLTRIGYAFAATDRICKEVECGRPLFFWQNGKYCTRHSKSHREHTVMVVLGKTPRGK